MNKINTLCVKIRFYVFFCFASTVLEQPSRDMSSNAERPLCIHFWSKMQMDKHQAPVSLYKNKTLVPLYFWPNLNTDSIFLINAGPLQ